MPGPLVTIITPSFNQGQFIEDCITSIKNQSYANIEHIIVDACSTDNTGEILEKYRGSYNVKIIIEPDNGPAEALNKGFNIAKGDILCWLNSDDYYIDQQVIATVVSYFEEFENLDIVTGCGYQVDKNKNFITPILSHKKLSYKRMKYADYILQPATFWKSRVHVRLDQSLQFTFDWVMFLQMFMNGAAVLVSDDFFSAYRMYDTNRTACDTAARKQEVANVIKNNFGVFSFQYFWAQHIYWLYKLSEITKMKFLKSIAIMSNKIMNKISFGRIVSC